MKLVTTKENVVIFKLSDDVVVNIAADKIIITMIDKGPDGDLHIEKVTHVPQLNSANAKVVENVSTDLPSEFYGHKFKYENNKFTVVDGWKEPELA